MSPRNAPVKNELAEPASTGYRTLTFKRASDVQVRPVRWLWDGRIALGTLALVGGREGIGKSTLCYQLAADITCGRMRGAFYGEPKAVIVVATEDSWEHTIVPRLMAAGAGVITKSCGSWI
jgi:predicted ATP-dependent serine protease